MNTIRLLAVDAVIVQGCIETWRKVSGERVDVKMGAAGWATARTGRAPDPPGSRPPGHASEQPYIPESQQ